MISLTTTARIALAAFLTVSCIAKWIGGYQQHYSIPESLFVLAIGAEMVLVPGLLIHKYYRLAAAASAVMAAVGATLEFLGGGATCGCMGSMFRMTPGQHILLDSTVGALAVMIWMAPDEASPAPRGI